ncbi:MAG: hypothetical protein IJM04_04105 [Prevotella sp.]|nr:hypothetical protein [Prevotella sp.]
MKTEKFTTKKEVIDAIIQTFEENGSDYCNLYEEVGMSLDRPEGGGIMAKFVFTKGKSLIFDSGYAVDYTLDSLVRLHKEIRSEFFQRKNGDFKRRYLFMRSDLDRALKQMMPGGALKLVGTECPRMFSEGAYREICQVDIPCDQKYAVKVGWHDDRCKGKGANFFTNLTNCPMETMVEIFEIICRKLNK